MPDLGLTGARLLGVEHDVFLRLELGGGWQLAVEGEYELHLADGASLRTDRDEEPLLVAHLHAAVGTPLSSSTWTESGELRVGTTVGELRVPASPESEAWGVVGPGGRRVVALPGGGVAVWS